MKKICILFIGLVLLSCGPDVDILQTVLIAPSRVDLVFPEDNSECTAGVIISETESEVIFDWSDADVGDGYRVSLTNLTTSQEAVYESDESSLSIRILRGTPYQWNVTTYLNDLDEPTVSNTEVFYNAGPGIQSFIPFPATNIAPENGEQLSSSSNTVTLQWNSEDLDGDITAYDIYFGATTTPELIASDLATTSLANISISTGEVYFWRVVTRDTQGNESNSDLFTFQVSN